MGLVTKQELAEKDFVVCITIPWVPGIGGKERVLPHDGLGLGEPSKEEKGEHLLNIHSQSDHNGSVAPYMLL